MTIFKISRSKRGSSGQRQYRGFPEFSLEYDLYSNTPDEQQASVLTYFEQNVIARGEPYVQGLYGALDPGQAAVCTAVRARWDQLSCDPYIWHVTADFRGNQFGYDPGSGSQGNPPETWNLQFSTGSQVLENRRVYRAWHMGGLSLAVNQYAPIQNATGAFEGPEPIYEPWVGDFLRVTLDVPDHDQDVQRSFYERVNDAPLEITGLRNFAASYAQYTLKLREVYCEMLDVDRDPETAAPSDVKYRVTWLFDYDPDGHVRKRWNAGYEYKVGASTYIPFHNCDGVEYTEPQPLAADGTALADSLSQTCSPAKPYHIPPVDKSSWIEVSWRTAAATDLKAIPYVGLIFAP